MAGELDDQVSFMKHYQTACAASIVMLMQLGFTFLEVGSVRVQFTKSVLMKNMVDMILSGLFYFAVGFAFAFGDGSPAGGFIGTTNFFLISNKTDNGIDVDQSGASWIYHWSYCATAITIVSGAVAERTQLAAYGIHSIIVASVVYPPVTQWIWSNTGWASQANPDRAITAVRDDAGGIAVHAVGGMCALVICYFVGPRQHRLNRKGNFVKDLPQQNQSFIVFGMFVLWFSWYAFNAGPAILAAGDNIALIGRISVYTTVCASSSGTMYLLLSILGRRKLPEPSDLSNGILAGLVASTSGCSVTQPYYGIVVGSVAGLVAMCVSKLLRKLKIDDVVDAIAVHLGCGVWSGISAPFFADTTPIRLVEGVEVQDSCGIFTGCKNGWKVLGSNVLVTVITLLYVAVILAPTCLLLRQCRILRINVESEVHGVDMVEFEGSAYCNEMTSQSQRSKLSSRNGESQTGVIIENESRISS